MGTVRVNSFQSQHIGNVVVSQSTSYYVRTRQLLGIVPSFFSTLSIKSYNTHFGEQHIYMPIVMLIDDHKAVRCKAVKKT
jgi:hypothetical protein